MDRDALDLLRAFIAHEVRFLVVGAHALGYHSEPRTTGDLDLFIGCERENAARAYAALAEFGAPLQDLTVRDLETPGVVFQMGVEPYRIDVLTQLSGVSFAECWDRRVVTSVEGMAIPIIGYDDLVTNKRATGRPKDLLDLELLERHRRR